MTGFTGDFDEPSIVLQLHTNTSMKYYNQLTTCSHLQTYTMSFCYSSFLDKIKCARKKRKEWSTSPLIITKWYSTPFYDKLSTACSIHLVLWGLRYIWWENHASICSRTIREGNMNKPRSTVHHVYINVPLQKQWKRKCKSQCVHRT